MTNCADSINATIPAKPRLTAELRKLEGDLKHFLATGSTEDIAKLKKEAARLESASTGQ